MSHLDRNVSQRVHLFCTTKKKQLFTTLPSHLVRISTIIKRITPQLLSGTKIRSKPWKIVSGKQKKGNVKVKKMIMIDGQIPHWTHRLTESGRIRCRCCTCMPYRNCSDSFSPSDSSSVQHWALMSCGHQHCEKVILTERKENTTSLPSFHLTSFLTSPNLASRSKHPASKRCFI